MLWIAGDTVLYRGVRHVADRVPVSVALMHLGEARFPVTGRLRHTMTARQAVELCRVVRPRPAIPVHYEGWSHFREGRAAIEAEIRSAPADARDRFRLLDIGDGVDLVV